MSKTTLLAFIVICMGWSHSSYGSKIVVSGNIASSTTWLADTVEVSGDLTINSGVTLTINPGTYVEVAAAR